MAHSAKSYAHAREVTRREAKNFYYAFRLLDPPRRNAIYAVYAFSRRADDAVDSVQEKNVSEQEARSKLAGLGRLMRGEAPEDPLKKRRRRRGRPSTRPMHPAIISALLRADRNTRFRGVHAIPAR